jgi:hypothetical protein
MSAEERTRAERLSEHYGLNVAGLIRMLVKRDSDLVGLDLRSAAPVVDRKAKTVTFPDGKTFSLQSEMELGKATTKLLWRVKRASKLIGEFTTERGKPSVLIHNSNKANMTDLERVADAWLAPPNQKPTRRRNHGPNLPNM